MGQLKFNTGIGTIKIIVVVITLNAMESPIHSPTVDRSISNSKSSDQVFDMTNGARTTVQEVDTKAELQSATNSSTHADWVLMTGNISMGSTTLDLANGVKLTGNGITLDDGGTFLANGLGNNKTSLTPNRHACCY